MQIIQQDNDQLKQIRKDYTEQKTRYEKLIALLTERVPSYKVNPEILVNYNAACELDGTAMGTRLLRGCLTSIRNTAGYYLRTRVERFFDPKLAMLEVDDSLTNDYVALHKKVRNFDDLAKAQQFDLNAVSIAYAETLTMYRSLVSRQNELNKTRQQRQRDQKKAQQDRTPVAAAKTTLSDLPGAAALSTLVVPPPPAVSTAATAA